MSWDKVLLRTPAGQRFLANPEEALRLLLEEVERRLADSTRRLLAVTERETVRKLTLRLLQWRFGVMPDNLTARLLAVQEQQQLEALHDVAGVCSDLYSFRRVLDSLRRPFDQGRYRPS